MGWRSSSSSQWRAGYSYGELRTGDSKKRSVMISVYQRAVARARRAWHTAGPPAMWGAGWSRMERAPSSLRRRKPDLVDVLGIAPHQHAQCLRPPMAERLACASFHTLWCCAKGSAPCSITYSVAVIRKHYFPAHMSPV